MRVRLRWAFFWTLALSLTVPLLGQAPHSSTLALQDALSSGKMTVEFEGDGGSSGDSIKARPAKGPKAGPGPVEAGIAPGSVLRSSDLAAQSMMVVGVRGKDLGGGMIEPASRIVAGGKQPATYILSAFCINFEKENPSSSTTFTLERPDPVLACIAKRGQSLSVPALQAAVWMYTDHVTYASMSHKFPVSPLDWAQGDAVYSACKGTPTAASDTGRVTMQTIQMNAIQGGGPGPSSQTLSSPLQGAPVAPVRGIDSLRRASAGIYDKADSVPDLTEKRAQEGIPMTTKQINDPGVPPDFKRYWYVERAIYWAELHVYGQAIEDLTEALKLPFETTHGRYSDSDVYRERSQVHAGNGEWAQAIVDEATVARLEPDAKVFWQLASLYEYSGDAPRALENYNTALALDPNNTHILGSRAHLYYNLDSYELALKDLDRAIAAGDSKASIWRRHVCSVAKSRGRELPTCQPNP